MKRFGTPLLLLVLALFTAGSATRIQDTLTGFTQIFKDPRGRMHSGADTSALPPPLGF